MLTIRKDQIIILGKYTWQNFLKRALIHLHEDLNNYVVDFTDTQLCNRIARVTVLAESYGLKDEYDIICFLDAGFLLKDEQFHKNTKFAPICSILEDNRLDSGDKAEQILTLAVQQLLVV